ncbi:hypothetical protein AAMO2058_001609400 [Amorphochlora amoebiformis]
MESKLKEAAAAYKDWTKLVVFDGGAKVVHSTSKADTKELKNFLTAFDKREDTIGKGLVLDGEHYEIHRWSKDTTHGRRGTVGNMHGICLHKVTTDSKKDMYAVITWGGRATSARIVPELQEYSKKNIKPL